MPQIKQTCLTIVIYWASAARDVNGYFDFKPKTAKCIFRDFFTGLDYFFKTGSLYPFSVVFKRPIIQTVRHYTEIDTVL